jgi:hypothetical protein
MRSLHPPTLTQWTCEHRWKTTTSRPGEGDVICVRYLTCQRCGLKLKTDERPAVPWKETDLVAQVEAMLPEGKPVYLRDRGVTEPPLEALNGHLKPLGYRIQASQGWYAAKAVRCVGPKDRVRWYALFELQRLAQKGEQPVSHVEGDRSSGGTCID